MTDENKQAEAPAQPATAPADAPKNAPAELTINDLNAIKTVIDVASTRGAFRANEMEAVGKVFNKLNSFLESVTPKQPAEGEKAPDASAQPQAQPAPNPAQ